MSAPPSKETTMKKTTSLFLAIIFTLAAFIKANAQSAETVWLAANATTFKTGETAVIMVNAISGTQVQG